MLAKIRVFHYFIYCLIHLLVFGDEVIFMNKVLIFLNGQ